MDRQSLEGFISNVSFVLGLLLVVLSLFVDSNLLLLAIVVLGLVVGIFNVQVDEVVRFLVALVAVMATSTYLKPILSDLSLPAILTTQLFAFFDALILFMGPAALVVGIKTLLDITRD